MECPLWVASGLQIQVVAALDAGSLLADQAGFIESGITVRISEVLPARLVVRSEGLNCDYFLFVINI